MKRAVIAAVCVLCAGMLFAADRIKIVTSIVPLYNITKAIAGVRADISEMVPPGASPHTFSPKPSQMIALAGADVFIQAGAGMEFWADKLIQASGNKKLKVLKMTDGLKLIAGDEDEPSGNPHVWLDPVIVKSFCKKIYETLAKLSPENRDYFRGNFEKFSGVLDKLDSYITGEVKKFKIKELVSFHPAWVYFESRYGLKEIAVIEVVPGREPTPKELMKIVAQVKKYGIKTIFAETTLPRKAADVIAQEAGAKVLLLDPEGGAGEDYITFMRRNFDVIKEAMK